LGLNNIQSCGLLFIFFFFSLVIFKKYKPLFFWKINPNFLLENFSYFQNFYFIIYQQYNFLFGKLFNNDVRRKKIFITFEP